MKNLNSLVSVLFLGATLAGCANMSEGQKGAVKGGAVGTVAGGLAGGVIGAQTGHKDRGAIIGAVTGGVLGAIIGARMNQQKEELEQVQGVEKVQYDQEEQRIEATLRILFDVNKAVIKPSEAVTLDQLAEVFAKYPENKIVIEGHTDSDGSEAYNQKLSEERAKAIETYLWNKKLDIARLVSVGYGEMQPIASNETAAGKAQNRRVEIKISVDPERIPQQQQQPQPIGQQ